MKNLFTVKNKKRIAAMLLVTLMTAAMAGCTSAVADVTISDVVTEQEVLSSTQADEECEAAAPDVDGEAVHNEEEVYEISKLDNGCIAFAKSDYRVKSADYVEPVVEADSVIVETAAETTVEAVPAETVAETTIESAPAETIAETTVETAPVETVAETTVEAPAKTETETAASSVEPAAAAEIAANTDLYGHYMYGRCTIPSVGMSVALYMPASFSAIYNSQSVVDTADAAAILSYSWSGDTICSMDTEEWMVADHKNQAFSLLKNVSVGDSMYIDTGDAVTEYVCIDIQDGINNYGSEYWSDKSSGLYTMDGARCSSLNQGGMVFYTCQENYLHVKLYFWQPV